MKKLYLLLLIACPWVLSATQLSKQHYTQDDMEELIQNVIPSEYVETFLFYTSMDENPALLQIQLLAIGKLESDWVKVKSDNINKNGTYDVGYLMLNSDNINNKQFMRQFSPLDEYPAKNTMELYLITCIRYYQYLCQRYGYENGTTIYNAGETQYVRRVIPVSTRYYVNRVNKYITDYSNELHAIARKNEKTRKWEEELREWERQRAESLLHQTFVEHCISIQDYPKSLCQRNHFFIQNSIECIIKKREEWANLLSFPLHTA
ncbi:MAG: hypothetical protein LBJ41_02935 [Treponema sp.]|jgi:hypothetical protein|nr:hypothetical protein [Treponema sp.]